MAKEESAQVICEVDAFPAPDSFKWLFNHTTKPIPEARYSSVDNRKGISILTFSPQTELDYGILMCYARNAVGQQKEPCVFHIIPAGTVPKYPRPPDPAMCMKQDLQKKVRFIDFRFTRAAVQLLRQQSDFGFDRCRVQRRFRQRTESVLCGRGDRSEFGYFDRQHDVD